MRLRTGSPRTVRAGPSKSFENFGLSFARSRKIQCSINCDLTSARTCGSLLGHYVILFWIDGDVARFERVVYGSRDLPSLYQ